MQIVRTIVWVLLLVGLVLFSAFNWEPVKVVLWPNSDPALRIVADTKVPVLVIVSFLLGFVPMWLLHRISAYYARRKITSLQTAARTATVPLAVEPAADPLVAPEHPLKSE